MAVTWRSQLTCTTPKMPSALWNSVTRRFGVDMLPQTIAPLLTSIPTGKMPLGSRFGNWHLIQDRIFETTPNDPRSINGAETENNDAKIADQHDGNDSEEKPTTWDWRPAWTALHVYTILFTILSLKGGGMSTTRFHLRDDIVVGGRPVIEERFEALHRYLHTAVASTRN